jgi:hypothetical protein
MKTAMNDKKAMTDQSMLWGWPVSLMDLWGVRLMFVGGALGLLALAASLTSSFVLYKVADRVQSEADQKIASANAEAAKANERAISLENDAAQAKLEQEKLKQLLAWRTLSEIEIKSLTDVLKKIPESVPRWVSLQYVLNDSESLYLTLQISRIFEENGWNVTLHACTWVNTIIVGLHITGDNDVSAALRSAFSAAKLDFSIEHVEEPNSFTTDGPRPSVPTRHGLIVVGSKAPPFRTVNDPVKPN